MKTMFCSKNIFVQTHIGINDTKRFKVQTLWSILGLVLGQKVLLSGQRFIVQMSSVVWHLSKKAQENLNLKFCQNWFSNSWDIADMDISRQVKYCLDKCHCCSWHLLKMVTESRLWSLVKINSVTAEVSLILTYVLRSNVTWTNFIVIVGICWWWSWKLTLKFCQNRVSNSCGIADMDNCRQDECCMDIWSFNNCLRLPRVNG